MIDVNSYIVRVFDCGDLVYTNGPRNWNAAIDIYRNCIMEYLQDFGANETFRGHFDLNMYSDRWINETIQFRFKQLQLSLEEINSMIYDIGQTTIKGHMKIELFHASKLEYARY